LFAKYNIRFTRSCLVTQVGSPVSSAGDVNGDGLDDLIVGAYYADPSDKSNAGKSYVVFGKQDNAAINLSAIAAGTKLIVALSCLPNTTYDLPASDAPLASAFMAPIIKSSKPSPLTSPALETEWAL
jgi:hypothetical protein